MFGMDDVTAKVAYAYSKQQALAYVGIVLAGIGALLAVSERAELVLVIGDAALLAAGAIILFYIGTRKNLAKINRPSLRILGIAFLVKLVTLPVSTYALAAPSPDLAVDLASLVFLVAMVIAYPLPIRRSGGVLFAPDEIRVLSDGRTVGVAAVFVAALGLVALPLPHSPNVTGGLLGSALVLDAVTLVLAAALAVVFLRLRGTPRSRAGSGLLLGSVVVGVVALWDVPLIVAGGAGLVVLLILAKPLNSGKRIISHRS
jgi:hypothetical protein